MSLWIRLCNHTSYIHEWKALAASLSQSAPPTLTCTMVQRSNGMIQAFAIFRGSWARFRMPLCVSTTIARQHLA